MRYLSFFFVILLLSCQTEIKYPEGGFAYPKNLNSKDTNRYFYQLQDSGSKQEVFSDYYAYLFYRPFNEPNLSIKPRPKESFRLIYSSAFGYSIIVTLTENLMTVKTGNAAVLYEKDTSRLTPIENFHLILLEKYFPIDTSGKSPEKKHYLDSLLKLYPQLHDVAYYHQLYDKMWNLSNKRLSYSEKKLPIKKEIFVSLVQEINSSGYWSLPYRIQCDDYGMDGYGFSLEANTKKKFKIVTASSCDGQIDTEKFRKACQKIVDMAGLSKEIILLWSDKNHTIKIYPVELEPVPNRPGKTN